MLLEYDSPEGRQIIHIDRIFPSMCEETYGLWVCFEENTGDKIYIDPEHILEIGHNNLIGDD